MGEITQRDAMAAVRTLAAIASGSVEPAAFVRRSLAEIPRLVASELTTLSACDLTNGRRTVVSDPPDAISAADAACFNRHFHTHPLVRYHSAHPDGGAQRISDALSGHEFRHSALFNDYYRHLGIDSVIAVPLYVDNRRLVSLVLNRKRRDFSARDRALLDVIRRPLAAMYRHSLQLADALVALGELRAGLESHGWAAIAVDAQRRLAGLAPRATALLASWWPAASLLAGAVLPPPIDAWLRRADRSPGAAGGSAISPLVLTRAGRRLTLRWCPDPNSPDARMIFVRESGAVPSGDQFQNVTLTPREGEVLGWVAAGKTNGDIAAILGASVRTIEKHLEHVFAKLGVETRTAAVMRALALADRGR